MNEEINVIDYRLQQIENEIKGLKELLVTVPILNNDLTNLEHRIEACETNIDLLNKEVNKLRNEPTKKSAEKWNYILDYMFKTVVTIIIGYFFYKVGLSK